ncbi:MAG: ABC transporter ATP-binding protein [Bdellovibrionales bacterium]|nr:ABC transporter ATP-binding protein [Bdellovibrionales bacterium]
MGLTNVFKNITVEGMHPIIEIQNVTKSFGAKTVLDNLSLKVMKGRFYSLVGESGSGKTTTLRLINGLEKPTSGQVLYDGEALDYKQIIPVRRTMGYCLQGYTLFPHMTISDNITVVAKKAKWSRKRIDQRLEEVMDLLGLDPAFYLKKMPNQLSGGQRQRVGIARALFMNPKILLMDEPFGALDPITRNELQDAFVKLQQKLQLSVVLVTHDLSEAFKMSHEIMVLNQGSLAQQGKPNSLLIKPADQYVESFLKSNSPGHILKEVPLFSVLYSDVWLRTGEETGLMLKNCDSHEVKTFDSENELDQFLRDCQQKLDIAVDSTGKFLWAKELASGARVERSIGSEVDLLSALQELFHVRSNSLPVVNQGGVVVGIFGREALDVIG